MFYLKKLLKKNKLVKYWLFFNSGFNNAFKINQYFYSVVYSGGCFVDFFKILDGVKKVVPLFFSLVCLNNKRSYFLFIASRYLYANTILNGCSTKTKILTHWSPGIFNNCGIQYIKDFNPINYVSNPALVILFSLVNNNSVLEETKIKNIPTICLITNNTNTNLVDYPICINNIYFHSTYFFTKFFFKLIFFSKQNAV